MIAVDTSAIVAIALREPEADAFAKLIQAHGHVLIGTPTLFEVHLVGSTKFAPHVFAALLETLGPPTFEVVPFTTEHLASAAAILRRFGKGHHPAALTFGDCMAYAIADVARCPLLFKGNDFAQTDIDRVI